MKAIKTKAVILFTESILSIFIASFIFLNCTFINELIITPVIILAVVLSIHLLSMFLKEISKLHLAKLIIDNTILHIQPAVVNVLNSKKNVDYTTIESIEIYVSCFGILLNSNTIKFNQDGIRLKAVELGSDYICLTYGTDRKTLKTRILHETINSYELISIAERFRFETGIHPVITSYY